MQKPPLMDIYAKILEILSVEMAVRWLDTEYNHWVYINLNEEEDMCLETKTALHTV